MSDALTASGGIAMPWAEQALEFMRLTDRPIADALTNALLHPKLGPPNPNELCDTPLWMLDDDGTDECQLEPVTDITDYMYGDAFTRRVCKGHGLRYWRGELASAQSNLAAVEVLP